eukprot:TRINITY_DN6389_c0_g1_i1.p1 TRINITY_DN6389_c0_g1~~TRINITY_DN6389_c0_g1_i1.p1  ORF type:complete len:509 (-),score=140.93 TRINITY_DN6389_c0_g1_i1:1424-2950(-)
MASNDSPTRASMKVDKNNTASLLARFENLKSPSSQSGIGQQRSKTATPVSPPNNTNGSGASYGPRSATLTSSQKPPSQISPVPAKRSLMGSQRANSPAAPANQSQAPPPQQSLCRSGGSSSPVSPRNTPSAISNNPPSPRNLPSPRNAAPTATSSATAPKGAVAAATAKFQRPSGDYDDEMRNAPKQKPKPDARKTMAPAENFRELQLREIENERIAQEEAKKAAASLSMSNGSIFGNVDFQISEKWRINYEELEFDQLVSSGSAGEVYMGYYFGTPVAIKKLFALAPDQKHLVAREFSMLQGVNHPNVVQFLGICDHSTGIYLITEYVEHGDLFDLLVFGEEDIGWKAKAKISSQIATAMYYLHSRNIIHRDLKSQNVLIGESMKVKLCDLGLATIIENKKRMTVCGTDEWMAPEIVLADHYDSKVDVFSFGIVLTEMISNQPPKKRTFENNLAFDEERFRANLPEDCPDEIAQLAVDCTRSNPDERPPFKEIVVRLRKLVEQLSED